MKKLLLSLVASVLYIAGAQAQEATTYVATLSHDGSLSAYYGQDALKDAYSAARDGDIITLSAGTFNSVNISKNITLRGVGAWADPSSDNKITYVGGTSFKLQDNDFELKVEGICFTGGVYVNSDKYKECTFAKVKFNSGHWTYNATISLDVKDNVYAKMTHCVAKGYVYFRMGIISNSVIGTMYAYNAIAPITLQNCVLIRYNSSGSFNEDVLSNCIIIGNGSDKLSVTNDVKNCAFFCLDAGKGVFFDDITNTTNMVVDDRDKFFKQSSTIEKKVDQYGDVSSYNINFDDLALDGTGLYELSDEAKAIYKGNDGTVVGVWGGTMPFNYIPNNPRITKCDIVPKVDADGKLSVTIEVAQ